MFSKFFSRVGVQGAGDIFLHDKSSAPAFLFENLFLFLLTFSQ